MKKITPLIGVFIAIAFLLTIGRAKAEAPIAEASAQVPEEIIYTKEIVIDMIGHYASQYGVDKSLMTNLVSCETGGTFKIDAQGDHGHSWGLSQIYLPAHPTITKEQATDPDFALDFMASNLSKGKGSLWTTYTALKNGGSYTFFYKLENRTITIYCKPQTVL